MCDSLAERRCRRVLVPGGYRRDRLIRGLRPRRADGSTVAGFPVVGFADVDGLRDMAAAGTATPVGASDPRERMRGVGSTS